MKSFVLLLVLTAAAGSALADPRPNTTAMTCVAAAQKIAAHGAVVMETGPALFDRFVASRAFCTSSETTEPAFVTTRDNPSCMIGYRCKEVSYQPKR